MLHSITSLRGMVTAPHHLAAQAGRDVLRGGGTAVEAAVAVAACLSVVYPHMTGIGGDGFWLIHEPDGRVHAIDACGAAAGSADLSLYDGLDAIPWRGPLAANTVAGTVSGWAAALATGRSNLPLDRLLRGAIDHAEHGVVITCGGAAVAAAKSAELRDLPGAYAATFEAGGRPLREGDILRQPRLAATLRRLVDEGLASFYTGTLAADIAADLTDCGSPVAAADLANHRATKPAPLHVTIPGATLYNTGPPTQGLASLLILALVARFPTLPETFGYIHGIVEATKQAFLIRDAHVGDPAYMTLDAQTLLDDPGVLAAMARNIRNDTALPWPQSSHPGDTCWFATADTDGRTVSCIQSTYLEFGSGIVLPRTGITWQNRGSSFRLAKSGWNALKPGRKPFHTLNPALAHFEDGRIMAYGTMGGEGQPQTQAALFTRYAQGMPLQEAITAPRWLLGRTWGDNSTTLKLEDRIDPAVVAQLRAAGHDVELLPAFTSVMGHSGALVRHPNGVLEGATDPRSDGQVASW